MQELESIRKDIEKMNKFYQVEILKLLNSCSHLKLKLNENNNGTFINMVDIGDDILIKISNYINYVLHPHHHFLALIEALVLAILLYLQLHQHHH